MRPRIVGAGLVLFVCLAAPAVAQQPAAQLPAAARQRLDSLVGRWTSRWDYIDETGKVLATATGSEVGRYILDDRLVEWTTEITRPSGQKSVSKAWWFYSMAEKKLYLNSVSHEGELWILTGDPVEFVITSWPKKQADGRTIVLRFTHTDGKDGVLHALMEFSYDDGKTWTKGFRQTLTPTS